MKTYVGLVTTTIMPQRLNNIINQFILLENWISGSVLLSNAKQSKTLANAWFIDKFAFCFVSVEMKHIVQWDVYFHKRINFTPTINTFDLSKFLNKFLDIFWLYSTITYCVIVYLVFYCWNVSSFQSFRLIWA